MARIRRALISVSDKTGVVEFARGLVEMGVALLSTGGTLAALREAGLGATAVSDYTGFPEMLDGRVKTLHPKIHGGLLGRRELPAHTETMARHGIEPIDLLAVNLYPFEETISRGGTTLVQAIEQIDIGGPAMIRSAAKNHAEVTVIVSPEDYPAVLEEMGRSGGQVSAETNLRLAQKAFTLTARYDGAIADYLGALGGEGRGPFGRTCHLQLHKLSDLRYGENPHQRAALYREAAAVPGSIACARQVQGKELSFNNLVDADAALSLVREFEETVAVVVKHTNPCGVATSAESVADAFRRARECDPVSIFGGIVAFNREVDGETARELAEIFLEIVVAPRFSPQALEVYGSQRRLRNVRLLEVDLGSTPAGPDFRRITGGMLVQERDAVVRPASSGRVVTRRSPTEDELVSLDFAWRVAKHVKSNAIVVARPGQVVGVGAGQMIRGDAARLALMRAAGAKLPTAGGVAASDAFFPFRDGIDVLAEACVRAVIQPGGSLRDGEVIAAADEHGMAMVFTGMRHFRH